MKKRYLTFFLLLTFFCWSATAFLIRKDYKDTMREFRTTQKGVLIIIQRAAAVARKMAQENLIAYAVGIIKSPRFRRVTESEISKFVKLKNIVGFGNILIFDDETRLIFHDGGLPEKYIGMTAARMYSEQIKRGGRGFEKTLGGIEARTEGCARYRFERGEPIQRVCWIPVEVSRDRVFTALLFADEGQILRSSGFYNRTRIALAVAFLLNLISVFFGFRYVKLIERYSRLEERALHQETILSLEERYRLLIEYSGDGITILDENGNVVEANRASLAMGGFEREDIIGRHFTDFFRQPHRDISENFFKKVFEEGDSASFETFFVAKSGKEIPISVSATGFMHEGRYLLQAAARNITMLKAREEERISNAKLQSEVEQLNELNTLKANFLSMVSHELRTPLSVMMGNIELAMKSSAGLFPEEVNKRLAIAQRRSRDIKGLIDDLMSLASIEADKQVLHLDTVPAAELVAEAAAACKDYSRSGNLNIATKVMPEDLVVTCDRQKLIQIMNYLIKNSIKFMGDSDSITICAEAADGETVFSVTDTGPGIPEEELSRIFERFHQVDSSATRRAGIGLSIARKMAELHGGRIRLLNIKPNGLRAEFSIPGESGLTADEPKQPTILIIDDDQEFCVLLAHFLCKKHFRVIMANDSAAGLRLTESDRVEVILIDTRISPEDGFTLCRAICGNPKTRDIPVIMLSTVYESELIKQAIAAGARDCILRPFEFEELLAKLKACTEPPG